MGKQAVFYFVLFDENSVKEMRRERERKREEDIEVEREKGETLKAGHTVGQADK